MIKAQKTIDRALSVLKLVAKTIRSDPHHQDEVGFHYWVALVATESLTGQIEEQHPTLPSPLASATRVRHQMCWRVSCIAEGPQSWPLDQREAAQAFADAHDETLELELRLIATFGTQDVIADSVAIFDPKTGEQIP